MKVLFGCFGVFFERVYSPTLGAVVGKGETAFVLMPVFGCMCVCMHVYVSL